MIPRVVCVYEKGNGFNDDAVQSLRDTLRRETAENYDFLCMTNERIDCPTVPLSGRLDGWWNKLELFRKDMVYTGTTVYIDLDTVILGDISPLFHFKGSFLMLRRFGLRCRRELRKWFYASGLMVWRGDFSFLHRHFREYMRHQVMGDQKYIEASLRDLGYPDGTVQDYLSVASYKGHCRESGSPPKGTDIVCFHGDPRPWDCDEQWIKERLV